MSCSFQSSVFQLLVLSFGTNLDRFDCSPFFSGINCSERASHGKRTPFVVNGRGEKVAVVIGIEEYEKLLEELEDLEDIRAYDEAMASEETPVPFEEAIERIERARSHTRKNNFLSLAPLYTIPLKQESLHCATLPDHPAAGNFAVARAGEFASVTTA